MTKILLSGSNGFLGTHIKNSHDNVVGIPHRDLQRRDLLDYQLRKEQPDIIIHCSAFGNMSTQTNENEIFKANVIGTWNLMDLTKDIPYKAFINISTSSVLLPVQTMYSTTKSMGEKLVEYMADQGKPAVTLRPTTLIGVGEQEAHLIPTLIRTAESGERMKIVPQPTHDFIDIKDFIRALDIVIEKADKLKGLAINIGRGSTKTNIEILQMVEKITGKYIDAELVSGMRSFDTPSWDVNVGLIRQLVWEPRISIEESISEMYEDFKRKNNKS